MTLREVTRAVISLVENVSGCPVVVSEDGSGVGSRILNFIYHPQISPFRNSESTIMSVLGRIQLENGKTGWERSGMADVAMALFLCRM